MTATGTTARTRTSAAEQPLVGRAARLRSDVSLGLRLAWATSPSNRLRMLLTAVGVGLCALVLLILSAAGPALSVHEQRISDGSPIFDGSSTATVEAAAMNATVGDRVISGWALLPLTTQPVVPPGVSHFPPAGEMVVSPALAAALAAPDGAALRAILPYRIASTIDPSVLPGPDDLMFYVHDPAYPSAQYTPVGQFGCRPYCPTSGDLGPDFWLVLVTGSVILIIPLLLFTAVAGRLGAGARDRRSAALRLLGASRSQLRRVTLVEAVVAGLVGVVLGWLGLLALRLAAPSVMIDGHGFRPDDVSPSWFAVVLIIAGVPGLAVLSALLGDRQATAEPLGVSRRRGPRPRLAWRFVFVVVVLVMTAGLVGTSATGTSLTAAMCAIVIGFLLCVPVLMPVVLQMISARFRAGRPALRMAVGRIGQDVTTSSRAAAGIATVLAGAIAMITVLSYASARTDTLTEAGTTTDANYYSGTLDLSGQMDIAALTSRLHAVAGVSQLSVYGDVYGDSGSTILIADCVTMATWTIGEPCRDGDSFRMTNATDGAAGLTERPGRQQLSGAGEPILTWTPPDQFSAATWVATPLYGRASFVLTPAAAAAQIPGVLADLSDVTVAAHIDPAALPAAIAAVSGLGLLRFDMFRSASRMGSLAEASVLRSVRVSLIIGSALTLLICAVGQLVSTAEQLTERRRAFALARATGVGLRTLVGSVVLAALVPILVGAVLATAFGLGLAGVLVRIRLSDAGPVNGLLIAAMAIGAVGFVMLVAVASTVRLGPLTGPAALRTE